MDRINQYLYMKIAYILIIIDKLRNIILYQKIYKLIY